MASPDTVTVLPVPTFLLSKLAEAEDGSRLTTSAPSTPDSAPYEEIVADTAPSYVLSSAVMLARVTVAAVMLAVVL